MILDDQIMAMIMSTPFTLSVFAVGALLRRVFVAPAVTFVDGGGVVVLESPFLAAGGLLRGASLRRVLLLLLLLLP